MRRLIQLIQYEKAQEQILEIREAIPMNFDSIVSELETLQRHLKNAKNKSEDLEQVLNDSKDNLLSTFQKLEANIDS